MKIVDNYYSSEISSKMLHTKCFIRDRFVQIIQVCVNGRERGSERKFKARKRFTAENLLCELKFIAEKAYVNGGVFVQLNKNNALQTHT